MDISLLMWAIAAFLLVILASMLVILVALRLIRSDIVCLTEEVEKRMDNVERGLSRVGSDLNDHSFLYWWMSKVRDHNPRLAQDMWNDLKERSRDQGQD